MCNAPNKNLVLFAHFALAVALAVTGFSPAFARTSNVGFLPPIQEHQAKRLVIYTHEGERLFGEVKGFSKTNGRYTKIRLELPNGEIRKLKQKEIRQMRIAVTANEIDAMMRQATTTLERALRTDYEQIFETPELIFDNVSQANGKHSRLRQRLNPGFDYRIQVYSQADGFTHTVNGKSFWGDMPKAFLVVKDQGPAFKVKKSEYRKKMFTRLFADCPALMERYQGAERKFRFFAEHVYQYQQMCPTPGAEGTVQTLASR